VENEPTKGSGCLPAGETSEFDAAQGQLTFERLGDQPAAATLLVTDITGKVVWRKQIEKGVKKTIWHTFGISGGIYFYRFVENDGTAWSGRVVLQK